MNTSTRRRITSDITDLDLGITKGFTAHDVSETIRRMEIRAEHADDDLDLMAYSHLLGAREYVAAAKDYSTLLLAACRYTAAIKGQQAAQVEMEAATAHLITLEVV